MNEKSQEVVKETAEDGKISKTSAVAISNSNKSKEISRSDIDINNLDYEDFSTPARMLALGKVLVGSKMCPHKNPEDVVLAIMRGNSLGLPPVVSISEIYAVNGKATLGVHVLRGILLQKGVWFNKERNAEPYYEFADLSAEKPTIVGTGYIDQQPKNTGKKQIDIRTEYVFEREIKSPSGKWKTVTVRSSFSIKQAHAADLMKKDNWINYTSAMLDSRAFATGAREIAGDLINGIYLPSEMIDSSSETLDVDYTFDDEGVETIIHKETQE